MCIYASIIFADYTSGRNYTLHDSTKITDESLLLSENFWTEYFDGLSDNLNWEFFRGREIISPSSEGVGVSRIKVYLSEKRKNFNEIINNIRSLYPSISIGVINDNVTSLVYDSIAKRNNWDDIVHINIDLLNISINRYIRDESKYLNKPKDAIIQSKGGINWNSKKAIIDILDSAKYRAFLSNDIQIGKMKNYWANFVLNTPKKLISRPVIDALRAYITLSLLTIVNDNDKKFVGIGGDRSLIILSGELIGLLDKSKMILSLIDGLELIGNIDLVIDSNRIAIPFGVEYMMGFETDSFVMNINDVFPNIYKMIIPETVKSNIEKKVIFTGSAVLPTETSDIYALSSELSFFDFEERPREIVGKFVNGTKIFKGEETLSVSKEMDGLIIDGRSKPVVYGPDARTNKLKLEKWLNENS